MGAVELSVSDLDRSLEYWQRVVGLRVLAPRERFRLARRRHRARPLRRRAGLASRPTATRASTTSRCSCPTGRVSRAGSRMRRATRLGSKGSPITTSARRSICAIPDRHGIEIYADRPRELWEGQVSERMTTLPLDVENLLGELDDPAIEPFDGLPDGTTVGHVHLRVADVESTVEFYRDVLGMGLMAQLGADGRVPERRRLPPPRRRQHVGEPRRGAGGPGIRHAPARDDRRSGCGRARPRRRAAWPTPGRSRRHAETASSSATRRRTRCSSPPDRSAIPVTRP